MRTISKILILASVFVFMGCTSRKKVLVIGDSISIGYTPYVKEKLKSEADVVHNRGNAKFSKNGLDSIYSWIGNTDWDVIHFNFGLWDLCYRLPSGERDKNNGKLTATVEEYKDNLDKIVSILKETDAEIIFANTTMVPSKESGRYTQDVERFNMAAEEVMKKHNIEVNDLYSLSLKVHPEYGLGNDNVHYKKDGYKVFSEQVVNAIRDKF